MAKLKNSNETFLMIFQTFVLFPKQIFCLSHLFSFFRLKRLSPKMATIIVRVPDMISKTGTTRKSWEAKVKRCRRKIPMAIDPEDTVMAPNAIKRILVISTCCCIFVAFFIPPKAFSGISFTPAAVLSLA